MRKMIIYITKDAGYWLVNTSKNSVVEYLLLVLDFLIFEVLGYRSLCKSVLPEYVRTTVMI